MRRTYIIATTWPQKLALCFWRAIVEKETLIIWFLFSQRKSKQNKNTKTTTKPTSPRI